MRVKKTIFLAVCISALFVIVFFSRYAVGYGMYVDGTFVGVVHNHAEAAVITEIISAENQADPLSSDLYLQFLHRDCFTEASELMDNAKKAGKIETEIVTTTVAVPYSCNTIEDNTLPKGTETIVTEGIDGSRLIVTEITRKNGQIIKEETLSDTVTTAPVAQITAVGTKPQPAGVGTGSFAFPLSVISVSSSFGSRWNRQHEGVDFAADSGTDIIAADSGTVIFSGDCNGYGNLIILDHRNGYKTYYAHCSVLYADEGSTPEKGEVIARVGSTGNSTGPHLHFEIRKDDIPLNPLPFLPGMV